MISDKALDYVDTVVSCINYTYDRKKIRLEMLSHLTEKIDFYLQDGKNEEEANDLALRDMGDARTLGKELNKQHKPLLGWVIKNSKAFAAAAGLITAVFFIFNAGIAQARNQEIKRDTHAYISSLYWELNSITHLLKYVDGWEDSVRSLDHSSNPFSRLMLSLEKIKNTTEEAVLYLGSAQDLQAVSNMANSMDIVISCVGHGVTYNGQLLCKHFLDDGKLSEKEVNFLYTLREELDAIQEGMLDSETKELKDQLTLKEFSEIVKQFTYKYRIENLTGIGASN